MPLNVLTQFFRDVRARRANIARTLAADSRRSFWAMADQGVVSLGNFGVNILLFRCFDQLKSLSEYGDYWTLMELMLFFNCLQAALIIYPLTVRGAASDRETLSRLTNLSLVLTFFTWPLMASSVLVTAYVAHISLTAGFWAAVAMLLWQIQETTRRSLLAHIRFRAAVIGDVISYIGQIAAIVYLGWSGRLSLLTAFQAMALTSGAAALIQSAQIGLGSVTWPELKDFSNECWQSGQWLLSGNLTNFVAGPLYAWNLRFWLGDELLAINYAVTNLLRLMNPLATVITNLITPHAIRTQRQNGVRAALGEAARFTGLGTLVMIPYFAMLVFFPMHSLAFVYGWSSKSLGWPIVLQIAAVGAVVNYFCMTTGTLLNALEKSRLTFHAQVLQAGVLLAISMPLTAMFGLAGAALGILIPTAIQTALHLYWIKNMHDDEAVSMSPHHVMDAAA